MKIFFVQSPIRRCLPVGCWATVNTEDIVVAVGGIPSCDSPHNIIIRAGQLNYRGFTIVRIKTFKHKIVVSTETDRLVNGLPSIETLPSFNAFTVIVMPGFPPRFRGGLIIEAGPVYFPSKRQSV